MPTIDESLIHAYLDDELDPASRRLVERAAQADPEVARSLAELARLRGLMANVHRPPDPPDVSGAVLGRIRRAEARRRALQPIGAATVLALAAMLMLSILWDRPLPLDRGPRDVRLAEGADGGRPAIVAADPGAVDPAVAGDAPPAVEVAATADPPPEPGPPPAEAVVALDPLPADRAEALDFLLDLVDYPAARLIVVEPAPGVSVAALADELDEKVLGATLRADPRYGRLPSARGGPDDLFVFLADPADRERVRSQIEVLLGDLCRVVEPTPADLPPPGLPSADALVLHKAPDVPPVRPFSGAGAAPEFLARREEADHGASVSRLPTTEPPRPAPLRESIGPGVPGGDPHVVFIRIRTLE